MNIQSFLSIALTLFLVVDPFGMIPTYLDLVGRVPKRRQRFVVARELLIALGIMVVFHYVGQLLLPLLHIDARTVQLAGGIVIFLIAIRLIFPKDRDKKEWGEGEPCVVPIATPLIAGPSMLAVVMIFAQEQPEDGTVIAAIVCAWLVAALILWFAMPIRKLMTDKGLAAIQQLMGLIVGMIAIQLFLKGAVGFFK